MKKIFVDTNILLDHILQRGVNKSSTLLIKAAESQFCVLTTSSISMATVTYFLQKNKIPLLQIRSLLNHLLKIIDLSPSSSGCFNIALSSSFSDLEDAVQYYTALQDNCDVFVTENIRDFVPHTQNALPVFTAQQFLKDYSFN